MRYIAIVGAAVVLALSSNADAHQETYPMSASNYRQQFEVRLARYRERLEERMDEHRIAPNRREDARKRMALLELIVRGTIARAADDGTVTEAEANQIRDLSKVCRGEIYRDLGLERAKGE
jgi:hypothetical protein